ncbi:MAG: type II toxin-antitoxin system HicB family antitoxin [Thaumarchaeota archaeon]|nr:type II toxin-antitoxin system HicB family antitoxin [Nitrososphaerota archaeon]
MRTFTVAVERNDETGLYVAQCLEIPQAISQGKTEEEAIRNVKEAIELALEHLGERMAKCALFLRLRQ